MMGNSRILMDGPVDKISVVSKKKRDRGVKHYKYHKRWLC